MRKLTLRRVVEKFLAWAECTLAPATVAGYRHHLRAFQRTMKDCQVAGLRPCQLSAWAKSWHDAQAVIRCFNWAVKEAKLLRVNPFAMVRKPRRGARRRILTVREIALLMRRARPAARRFLLALRETIARPQEIRLARWEELCSENEGVSIEEALKGGTALLVQHDFKDCDRRTDMSRPRVLIISARLGRLICRVGKGNLARRGPIFKNARGSPWTRNAVRCFMRRLRRRLAWTADYRGENVVAYTMRHSIATHAACRGVVDRTLADLLGHVETRTTTRYLHLSTKHLRNALKQINARVKEDS